MTTLFDDDEDLQISAAELLTLQDASVAKILDESYQPKVLPAEDRNNHATLPLITDGSMPLENAEHERFLQYYLAGSTWSLAYIKAGHPNCTGKTATEQATRVKRRPEVQARLRFLLSTRAREITADEGDDELTDKEILKGLKTAWRTAITQDAKIAAAKLYRAIKDGQKQESGGAVDPAVMMSYIKAAAANGKRLVDLAGLSETPAGDGKGARAATAQGEVGASDTPPVGGDDGKQGGTVSQMSFC